MFITTLDGNNLDAVSNVVLSLFESKTDEASFVVLVPSFSSKMWLRRQLTKQLVKVNGGTYPIGLSVLTVEEFASEYGLPDLAAKGLMQCPRTVLTATVALDQLERGRVVDPQVLAFLVRSVERLLLLREEDLELLIEAGASEEIVTLARRVRSVTAKRYFHSRTLLECAISTLSSNPSNRIVVLQPRLFGDSFKVFMELLDEHSDPTQIEHLIINESLPRQGANSLVLPPQNHESKQIQISGGLTVIEELKIAADFIISKVKEGHPPSKMGLLFAQPNHYLPYWEILCSEMSDLKTNIVEDASGDAGHSQVSFYSLFNSLQSEKVRQLPVGQLLQSFLVWVDSDFSRVEFIDRFPGILSNINETIYDNECRTFEFWDLITTEANIYRGRHEWQSHLEYLKQLWGSRRRPIYLGGRALTKGETETVLKQLSRLSDFIDTSFKLFDRLQGGTFASMADAIIEYMRALVRPARVTTKTPSILDGFEELIEFANELNVLDSLALDSSFDTLQLLLQNFLEMRVRTPSSSRQLVTVAPLMSTLGTSFDYLVVIGMNDNLASLGGNASSSFDDYSVATLGLPLLTSKEFGDRALTHLVMLMRSSRGTLVTFDKTKVSTGGEVSESISQLLEVLTKTDGIAKIESAAMTLQTRTEELRQPLSIKDLLILIDEVSQLLELEATSFTSERLQPALSNTREVERKFKSREAEEGLDLDYIDLVALSEGTHLRDFPIQQGRVRLSPSQLESYVKCPYAFFVNSILGVSSPDRPEDTLYMSPRTMGELIHGVMEEILREASDDQLDTVHAISLECLFEESDRLLRLRFEELLKTGRVGRRAFESINFNKAKANIRRLLKVLDSQVSLEKGMEFITELRFDEIDLDRSISSIKNELPVVFTGKVDLVVDQGSCKDRQLLVVDYKTGSIETYREISDKTPTAKGDKFQLFIYALAVAKLFQVPIDTISTKYWFSSVFSGQRVVEVNFTPDSLKVAGSEVEKVVNLILQGAYMGRSSPRLTRHGSCEYCNPKGLKDPSLERVWLWHLSNLLNASIAVPNDWLDNVREAARQEGSS